MSDDNSDDYKRDNSFAKLIGAVTPLATKNQHPDFIRTHPRPVAQALQRRLAAQGTRPLSPWRQDKSISLNLDNVPAERFNAMQRGELPFARVIDLHGYFVAEGVALLDDALHHRRNRRNEIWLVIHGKGRNSPSHDRAPLKQAVIDLLCQHPAVAALSSLQDSDHDSGALCIDVYRQRRLPPQPKPSL